jgi:hypothetical protein
MSFDIYLVEFGENKLASMPRALERAKAVLIFTKADRENENLTHFYALGFDVFIS